MPDYFLVGEVTSWNLGWLHGTLSITRLKEVFLYIQAFCLPCPVSSLYAKLTIFSLNHLIQCLSGKQISVFPKVSHYSFKL